jgi:prepilin-type processing-associated H-X9-DG protein
LIVTADEHPDNIDDAWLIAINPGNPHRWFNMPASYHNGAAAFTFADGHSEIHKWLERSTIQPSTQTRLLQSLAGQPRKTQEK